MDNDDRLIGRVLTRREVLRLLGTASAAGAAFLAGCDVPEALSEEATATNSAAPSIEDSAVTQAATAAPTEAATEAAAATAVEAAVIPECVVRPALTEGPYFVDERLNRSDIRSAPETGEVKAGVPLRIRVIVSKLDDAACVLYPGVTVDVWHCDAQGVYSDVQDRSFNTVGERFLRGYQVTDQSGVAQFDTIYPGWYPGRAVHIHFKLRTDPDAAAGTEFTSQWFFDEDLTDIVHTNEPYADRGYRTVKNEGDGIFQQAGDQMILDLTPEGDGYLATFRIGIDAS